MKLQKWDLVDIALGLWFGFILLAYIIFWQERQEIEQEDAEGWACMEFTQSETGQPGRLCYKDFRE